MPHLVIGRYNKLVALYFFDSMQNALKLTVCEIGIIVSQIWEQDLFFAE